MCSFFSLVSNGKGAILYFNKEQREAIKEGTLKYLTGKDKGGIFLGEEDSHSSILNYNNSRGEEEDDWNRWEYNPDSEILSIDTLNAFDDSIAVLAKIKEIDVFGLEGFKPLKFKIGDSVITPNKAPEKIELGIFKAITFVDPMEKHLGKKHTIRNAERDTDKSTSYQLDGEIWWWHESWLVKA